MTSSLGRLGLALGLCFIIHVASAETEPANSAKSFLRLDHVAIQVKDLQTSADFYKKVFDMELLHKWTTTWMVGNGKSRLGLFQRPSAMPVDDFDNRLVLQHFAVLTTTAGLDAFRTRLNALQISYEQEDSGIAKSLFVTDPDGILVEVTAYYAKDPPI